MKRALVFLAITFGITYAYDFLVVYPIAQGTAPYASEFLSPDLAYMVSVALTLLFPALGVVLTRLVTREGFQMCAWCHVLALFLSYVTSRTVSTFAAAIGHGAVNLSLIHILTKMSSAGFRRRACSFRRSMSKSSFKGR